MATTISRYNCLSEYLLDGSVDLEAGDIRCALVYNATPASAFDATHLTWNAVSAMEITGTGYTQYGKVMTTSISRSTATATFDATDVSWAPIDSGSNKTFTGAVIFQHDTGTPANGLLIAFILFDSTPANITINAGVTFTIQFNASGILTLS